MKKCFLIVLLFLVANVSLASYTTMYYPTLIENAKIIAYGKIISVEKSIFKIIVLGNIKNAKRSDTLSIQKFQNWTCASRYKNYEIGQEGIYFIDVSPNKELIIMGAGNEGEIITRKDTCFIHGYGQTRLPKKKFGSISQYTEYIPLTLSTVKEGIKLYMGNFEPLNYMPANTQSGTIAYKYEPLNTRSNDFYILLLEQKKKLVK